MIKKCGSLPTNAKAALGRAQQPVFPGRMETLFGCGTSGAGHATARILVGLITASSLFDAGS